MEQAKWELAKERDVRLQKLQELREDYEQNRRLVDNQFDILEQRAWERVQQLEKGHPEANGRLRSHKGELREKDRQTQPGGNIGSAGLAKQYTERTKPGGGVGSGAEYVTIRVKKPGTGRLDTSARHASSSVRVFRTMYA